LQRSGATPYGAWATTTLRGKRSGRKTCLSLWLPTELKGAKYIHVLAPCPTGWRYDASKTVEIGRLAVQTGMWALYEIENDKFRLNSPSDRLIDKSKRKPVNEYLSVQERFRHLTEGDIEKSRNELTRIGSTIRP
jgi:pyruvate ferredoxin oxidoreductase beta subunit